ncbi:MAG: hypothetical protein ABIY52_01355 [Gemmatimonadaceae bacterium]
MACRGTEGPTSPSIPDATFARSGISSAWGRAGDSEDTVVTLKRLEPLAQSYSVSAVIGPRGGSLTIPEAGGTVVFPAGALATPTTITMTTRRGRDIAYDFAPHLQFPVPVLVQQDLHGTFAETHPSMLARLGGAYFEDDLDASFVDQGKRLARVKEVRAGSVDRRRMLLVFSVNHFSGYLASSGRQLHADELL